MPETLTYFASPTVRERTMRTVYWTFADKCLLSDVSAFLQSFTFEILCNNLPVLREAASQIGYGGTPIYGIVGHVPVRDDRQFAFRGEYTTRLEQRSLERDPNGSRRNPLCRNPFFAEGPFAVTLTAGCGHDERFTLLRFEVEGDGTLNAPIGAVARVFYRRSGQKYGMVCYRFADGTLLPIGAEERWIPSSEWRLEEEQAI